MRKISAHYLFTGSSKPIKNGIIVLSDSGQVLDVIDNQGQLKEQAGLEFYNGILVPGFINAHCHLELSHMHGIVANPDGLPGFIGQLVKGRAANQHLNIPKAIDNANTTMQHNGIVAVGDISNTTDTFALKTKSKIKYHTFIEIFNIIENQSDIVFEKGLVLYNQAQELGLPVSIVPHAPYTMSESLFKLIFDFAQKNNSILSYHNQESPSETDLFVNGNGKLMELFERFGIDKKHYNISGKNSLQTYCHLFPKENNVLLVHNTFSNLNDVQLVNTLLNNAYWVLCPQSNIYIENRLPDVEMLAQQNINIAIGTDSLASNTSLSVLDELKTLTTHFPKLKLETLVEWATLNGAKALKMDNQLGSIDIGKTPGINLISGINFDKMCLTPNSQVKVLA